MTALIEIDDVLDDWEPVNDPMVCRDCGSEPSLESGYFDDTEGYSLCGFCAALDGCQPVPDMLWPPTGEPFHLDRQGTYHSPVVHEMFVATRELARREWKGTRR